MRLLILGLLAVFFCAQSPFQAVAESKIGVVLMHGKRGTTKLIVPLEEAMRDTGFKVIAPEMPWSRSRFLDKTIKEILAEIDEAVRALKKEGATKIVIAGHSLGGGAALAYGARREGLAGVLVIAPGHFPESDGFQSRFDEDLAKAKSMVAAGMGEEKADFGDINQGESDIFSLKAKIYIDFMDPNGPFAMPKAAANLKKGTPLMLIIGKGDHTFKYGRGDRYYIFDKAPSHPKSVYKVVRGGHKATPRIGKDEIIAWLKSL